MSTFQPGSLEWHCAMQQLQIKATVWGPAYAAWIAAIKAEEPQLEHADVCILAQDRADSAVHAFLVGEGIDEELLEDIAAAVDGDDNVVPLR